ncbi:Alcohol acetyltransferase [Fusarium albosuccineum]|uniref:Alcohol acetyltransferase n=1 Tax=Fusarium albosuccineum TaxID=1237068 RepID=A0A8H4KWP2_9HYPO|nr:Alcohol acetyltransferase [Fusarium albosuccineum]
MGPRGILARLHSSLQALSLTTDGSCIYYLSIDEYGSQLTLSPFRSLKRFCWKGPHPQHLVNLHLVLENNAHSLEDLELDLIEFSFYSDYYARLAEDGVDDDNDLMLRFLTGHILEPPDSLFLNLSRLSLSQVEVGPGMINLFNFGVLRSLTLRKCPEWAELIGSIMGAELPLSLKILEIQDCNDAFGFLEFLILRLCLESFEGLGELYLCIHGPLCDVSILEKIAQGQPTLRRFAYCPMDCDKPDLGQDGFLDSMEKQGSLNPFGRLGLEAYGLTCDPRFILVHIRPTRGVMENSYLHPVVVGSSLGRSKDFNADSSVKTTHDDTWASLPFGLRYEFSPLAKWAFGRQGLASLELIVFGDFAHDSRNGWYNFMLCRSSDGPRNFRCLAKESYEWRAVVEEYRSLLESCPRRRASKAGRPDTTGSASRPAGGDLLNWNRKVDFQGPAEQYSTARSHLGIFTNVCVTATLASVIARHPILSAIPIDTVTTARFVRLPIIHLERVVTFVEKPGYTPGQSRDPTLDEFLEKQHNLPFQQDNSLVPFWRINVLTNPEDTSWFTLCLCFHHSLLDTQSAVITHEDLECALSSPQIGPVPDSIEPSQQDLLPSLESMVTLPTTADFVSRQQNIGEPPGYWWSGKQQTLPVRTRFSSVWIAEKCIHNWKGRCREQGVTLTSGLMSLIAVAFSRLLPQEYTTIQGDCAVSLRRFLPADIGQRSAGCYVGSFSEVYSRNTLSLWKDAKRTKNTIDETLRKKGVDMPVAYLKHVPNLIQWLAEKMGKKRWAAWELSNVGGLSPSPDLKLQDGLIQSVMFSQSASASSGAVKVSAASGRDGRLGLGFTWQDGIVDDELVHELIKSVVEMIGEA